MEQPVWIESRHKMKIAAVVHYPTETNDLKHRTLIYSHGFTGNKSGDNRMGVKLARFLAEKGFLVVRFDYLGSGESEGHFEDMTTFSGWSRDFHHVLSHVKNIEKVDEERIGLIGHSLSGSMVTYIASQTDAIKSVCALAPVYELVRNLQEVVIGPRLWKQAEEGKQIKDFYNKKYALNPLFVEDLKTYDMHDYIRKISIPFSILHGKKDTAISFKDSEKFYLDLKVEQKNLWLLDNEEHLFSDASFPYINRWFEESL